MKKRVFPLLMIAWSLAINAQQRVRIGDLFYNLAGATASVAASGSGGVFTCNYNNSQYIIPSSVQYNGLDYTVVEIGLRAFASFYETDKGSSSSSIVIPNTIETIQERAFCNCSNLISFIIPSSVKTMGDRAFKGCSLLRELFYLSETPPSGWCATSFTYVPNKYNYSTPSYSWGNASIIQMITFEENVFTYTGIAPTTNWTNNVIGYEASLEMPILQKNVGKYEVSIPVTFTKGNSSFSLDIVYRYEIRPATLTAIVGEETKLYGEENPQFKVSVVGFVNGEDESVIKKAPIASTQANTLSHVGTYPIAIIGGEAMNYTFDYSTGRLTILPRELQVSVGDYERAFDEDNPNFTIIYDGFIGSDNEWTLLERPLVKTTATRKSDVGTYPISVSGGSSPNYTLSYHGGILSVVKADQSLEWYQTMDNLKTGDQVELMAQASSGLPIKYTMDETESAELYQAGSRTYLDCKRAGRFQIKAIQEGNKNYYPSQRANNTVTIYGFVYDDPTLTIKQAENGAVTTQVTRGSFYTFVIKPEQGWKVHSVSFNDSDVTSFIDVDGSYTCPAIVDNSILSIAYEQEDGDAVLSTNKSSVRIQGMTFGIRVTDVNANEMIHIYTTDGILMKSIKADKQVMDITLSNRGTYIIKVGDKIVKLSI